MKTELNFDLGYYVANVLKSRRYGSTYKHAEAPTRFDHGDIRFSFQGYGRSLQSGGHKWKAYAYRGTKPVSTKELLTIK